MLDEHGDEQRLLNLIGAFYEAAGNPALWQGVARQMAALFQSESGMLLTADARSNARMLGVTENIAGAVWRDYQTYYYGQDAWVAGGLRQPGTAIIGHEVAPEGWYRSSAFLNELCARAGIHDVVGAALPLGEGRTAILGVHRALGQARFGRADKEKLALLLPHLQRAVRLTIRLENAGIDHQAALEGLERAHSATIVVDGHGAILFATRLAEAMLRRGDGVRAANGRLTCAGRAASDRLHRLIANAVAPPSLKPVVQCGGVAIEREDGRPPLTLLVAPFRPGGGAVGAPAPAALVLLRDLETSGMETEILRDLFGFTAAQATVAARLCNGDSVEEIAAALRITLYTTRDHMKAIFLKTGCCRQSQVVALLTRSVAGFGVASPPPHLPHQGGGT